MHPFLLTSRFISKALLSLGGLEPPTSRLKTEHARHIAALRRGGRGPPVGNPCARWMANDVFTRRLGASFATLFLQTLLGSIMRRHYKSFFQRKLFFQHSARTFLDCLPRFFSPASLNTGSKIKSHVTKGRDCCHGNAVLTKQRLVLEQQSGWRSPRNRRFWPNFWFDPNSTCGECRHFRVSVNATCPTAIHLKQRGADTCDVDCSISPRWMLFGGVKTDLLSWFRCTLGHHNVISGAKVTNTRFCQCAFIGRLPVLRCVTRRRISCSSVFSILVCQASSVHVQ